MGPGRYNFSGSLEKPAAGKKKPKGGLKAASPTGSDDEDAGESKQQETGAGESSSRGAFGSRFPFSHHRCSLLIGMLLTIPPCDRPEPSYHFGGRNKRFGYVPGQSTTLASDPVTPAAL